VMPKLNVTGDPELERLTAELRASLLIDPDKLRQSESTRTETAKRAAEIAERMAGYQLAAASLTPQHNLAGSANLCLQWVAAHLELLQLLLVCRGHSGDAAFVESART